MIVLIESCTQTNGDSLINNLAQGLQLSSDFSDCDGVVNYYAIGQGLGNTAVCLTLIDTVVENLPGTDTQKDQVRLVYPGLGIDPTTTVVSDFCECTCSNSE